MLDLRTFDDYTFRHSVNVAVLSVVIGMGMGYTNEELVDLCSAAVFHDLGKISIDKAILNKPGKLTPEENELLRSHSQRSYDMLKGKMEHSGKSQSGSIEATMKMRMEAAIRTV